MAETTDNPRGGWLRTTVLVLAGIETVLLGALVLLFLSQAGSSDPLSRAIGRAVTTLVAIPLLTCAVPALVLGVMGRWLKLALALAILAVPLTLAIRASM
jgi:hypothetical protein